MRIKTFTLFRRGKVYYAKKVYLGTVYTVTTGTKQLTQAQLLAPKLLAERIKGSERQLTVSQLLDMHLKYAVHLRPKTLKMIGQFTRIYLNELGVETSVLIQEAFCPDSAREFLYSRIKRAPRARHAQASITANMTLRMVKSLFSARMLECYGNLPEEILLFKKVRPLPVRHPQYSVSDKKEAMARVIAECEALKEKDPDAYLAYWLMLHCGLRRGEVAAAKWDWVTERGLHVRSDDNFQTKSGQSRLVPLSEAQVAHLRAFQGTNTFILGGAYTSCYRVHPDRVGRIIRRAGISGSKSVHELRKYYGANAATQLGLFAAQKYLGHHSPEITSRYYADLIDAKPVQVKILH